MIAILFWLAVGLLVYTYIGFPLLVLVRSVLLPQRFLADDITPEVSVIIAAHNEASGIRAKVENLLALDYPNDLLEIVIASDGSDDGTDAIVAPYEERQGRTVKVLSLPRGGKAATINAAVASTRGEILVFSDANSMYAPLAVRRIVRPFADPAVGGVAGDQRYLTDRSADGIARSESTYWSIDRLLKKAESASGCVISATGAIYAIRRPLFTPVRADVTDDFYTSTGVILQSRRLVFAPDAIAYEPTAATCGDEFGRKVRVMTRGLRGVIARRSLLNPFRYGFYAVQLFSHKVLRRLMPAPLMLLLVTGALRWDDGWPYRALTIGQAVIYGLGIVGLLVSRTSLGKHKPLSVPAFFCLVNAAAACAVWNVIRGNRIDRWQPRRVDGQPGENLAWRPKS